LSEFIKRKKDVFEPSVSPRVDYKNILMLSYYKNNIMQFFTLESMLAVSLFGFGHQVAWKEGIKKTKLYEQIQFISDLLSEEYVIEEKFTTFEDFDRVLKRMVQNQTVNLIQVDDEDEMRVKIDPKGEVGISFLCSLLWPIIDSYWTTFIYVFSLVPNKFISEGLVLQKVG
jgi:glycerol-3-phosphate O-acyltransferase